MAARPLVEHIWSTLQAIRAAEWIGDHGNNAFKPWYPSAHDEYMQELFDLLGDLSEDVGLTLVFLDQESATPWHMQFSALLPTPDMTPEEIAEEPSIISIQNGCEKIYIDVYPVFGGYDVTIRDNPDEQDSDKEMDDETLDLTERFLEALNAPIEYETQE